ncbi:tRNA (adenosine(37)-N6)-threonylcarbamoyltransferase complex transferase subunit TsaD [Amphiplicatus metriothermophilus]|uniref:tRNA N6-adenosine threonylcarbamoyltransferase n=1 Tax=Amphiplicatus metriothermophilus TaxID=1519374 RepID=A0A239PKD5_9PROT|nr:tRNA (adenosine(37)-N6)-threonylcarbamoyltransferase complex transferase subunit TsaD [Amphiplicatus metriothermophilus]MBB5517568.1 N6-L-threonylcarbamoyladenine synthase [Amphiplicatus metriothermophilus]SNT68097.1 O-sialoglycoprotein endopeptidase [Amphiplicatus metriothermophilus]
MTLVLGVETSCDDTAAGVIRRRPDGACEILADVVWRQYDRHAPYGGVVPEIAARSHVERVDQVIVHALEKSGHIPADLDAVAATAGPGLIGGVMVGLTAAKAIALAHDKPLIPVNHLEGHALSARLTEAAPFPYLLLLISGGHTQLIAVAGVGRYRRLGSTIDDAAGEAFDKTAKLLGLGQPGGPRIESAAVGGRASRFRLPAPLARREGCDFSFSGLKTAVRLAAEEIGTPTGQDVADLAAAFQATAAAHLAARTGRAMDMVEADFGADPRLVVAGGVAANCAIKAALKELADRRGWRLIVPPPKYCTDNGAMIAWAGAERLAAGLVPSLAEALAFAPRARWPLAPPPPGRAHGGGRKGPKA